ncbi:MAG: hypothetical protein II222_01290 [Paraprevotella sp.]|nr:hypothetical protein [Paraprevotella sp.]
MKRLAISLILVLGSFIFAHSQEVFNEVLTKAEAVVNNPNADEMSIKVNHFKSTALRYLRTKAFETQDNVTAAFLDIQAYYLSEFLSKYFKELAAMQQADEKAKKGCIMMFVNTSVSNPLFMNADSETAESFITAEGNLTPFSLNTNWEKACAAIDEQMKKIK